VIRGIKMKNRILGALVVMSALSAGSASAVSAYDVSGVTTALTDVGGQILIVGAAVLLVYVAIKAYKWIRRAL
jgi:hypothetical protein